MTYQMILKALFSIAHDFNTHASNVNKDLKFKSGWVFHWKMSFHPDLSKQEQEITFSRKNTKSSDPSVYSNNTPVSSTSFHKYLRMLLDNNLSKVIS